MTSNEKPMSEKRREHAGHRQRMKKKYADFGAKVFNDHELLEMLLFYSIPQRNTNEIAHKLVDEFKTPRRAIESNPQRLMNTKGVKHNTALLFSLISEIYRRDKVRIATPTTKYDKLSTVGEYLMQEYAGVHDERFYILMLDSSMRMIKSASISSNSASSTTVDPRTVARMALSENATNVIIAHNHPSGNATPSSADRDLTARIEAALSSIGITLIEHIVVGEVGYTPTMQMRISSLRSPFSKSDLDDGFLRKFYNS